MATADKLESSLGSGMKGIKEYMKDASARIKAKNAQADEMERKLEQVKQTYIKSVGRQQALRDRLLMLEERLERNKEKMKDVTKRVQEKEKFFEESKNFNKSLKVTVPDEGEVAEMEEKLQIQKEIYNKNYEKYQSARNKKVELEQELEHVELKAHDSTRRLEALRIELEYNQIEEARRAEGCKAAIDGAFKCEKAYTDLQNGLDYIMKRKKEATKIINRLEKEVKSAEDALDTLNFERRRTEATIRECLINLKNQKL